jgi:prolyl-tRNA synthetase
VSTRLIGGLIMTHADDDGLILPPKLAPAHLVLLPVIHKAESAREVLEYCEKLAKELRAKTYHGRNIEVEIDARDIRGGDKMWQWVKKGIPLRAEVGPRDIANDSIFLARRDKSPKDKQSIKREEFIATIEQMLDDMQRGMFERAKAMRQLHTREITSKEEFTAFFTPKKSGDEDQVEIHGGFALAHFCGDEAVEAQVKKDLGVTIRCVPMNEDIAGGEGVCIFTGKKSPQRVVFAKAY